MTEERTTWTTGSFTTHPNQIAAADTVPGLVLVYSRIHETIPPSVPIESTLLTVGREADNSVPIRESAVSRYHARIERRGGSCFIVDCGSTNGTLVNGRRVNTSVLQDRDVIRIGDTVFRFASTHAHRYSAYRVTGEKDLARCPPHGILDPLLVGGMQVDLVLDKIAKVARTTLSVIVQGESGTGKELVARELHRWSGRRGAFQAINCAAIPANLLESELFGYKRGAFTGANADKTGLIASAQGGTLFLDEIGDMPLEAQAKLLRILQEREVTPLGSTQAVRVDVRFIAATHRDLESFVAEGKFRGDLLARLQEALIWIPPLRARREDLLRLVLHFLARATTSAPTLGIGYMLALAHYDYPYNVRELESAVRLSVALSQGSELDVRHLPTIIQQALEAQSGAPSADVDTVESTGPERAARRTTAQDFEPTGRIALGFADHRLAPAAAPIRGVASPASLAQTWRLGDSDPEPMLADADEAAMSAQDARVPPPSEDALRALLARHHGNVAAVGRELGKERMQVHRWMKRYRIVPDDYRG